MTVRGNIEFALKSTGQYREKRHEIAEWLGLAELESFADSYPHQLSGGTRQRLPSFELWPSRPTSCCSMNLSGRSTILHE